MSPVSAFRRGSLPISLVVRVGLANADDIHKSDDSEEQECNGDLVEHVWHKDKSRGIATQLRTVFALGKRYCNPYNGLAGMFAPKHAVQSAMPKTVQFKHGRPTTDADPLISVRLPPETIRAIDRWAPSTS
jgi:hypothetical protein